MMLDVTAPRTPRPRAATKPKAPEHEGRKKSKLTVAREEGARLAGRTLLLGTCEALKWDLAEVAKTLDLATSADVIRALRELAPVEYEAARERGDIRRGRRPEET